MKIFFRKELGITGYLKWKVLKIKDKVKLWINMPFYVYMALIALNKFQKREKSQEYKWTWHLFLTCFTRTEDSESLPSYSYFIIVGISE